MDNEKGDDKPFEATKEKLDKSRKKGEIFHPTEVYALIALVLVYVFVSLNFDSNIGELLIIGKSIFSEVLALPGSIDLATSRAYLAAQIETFVLQLFSAFLLLPVTLLLLALVFSKRTTFAPDKVLPKIKKVSLLENAKKKYSKQAVLQYFSNLSKAIFVVSAFLVLLLHQGIEPGGLLHIGPKQAELGRLNLLSQIVVVAISVSAVFAAFDFFLRRLTFLKQQRMGHQVT